jgi:hypothetical protein
MKEQDRESNRGTQVSIDGKQRHESHLSLVYFSPLKINQAGELPIMLIKKKT